MRRRVAIATILLTPAACTPATGTTPAPAGPELVERIAVYLEDAIEAHKAVVEVLPGLGGTIEEGRADGRLPTWWWV